MSQKIYSNLDIKGTTTIGSIANATTDTDKFLVSDGGLIKYRTGAEMLSDLGVDVGAPAAILQHVVKAAVAINKGQAIYISGADGTNMLASLASNTSEATSSKTMGLLDATVAINGFANVVSEGLLAGLNTIGATAGDPVWLGTGGNLIYGLINKPYAPAHLVFIGIVTRVNLNNGEIFVRVQNGFELNEIHDVDLKTTLPINGDILGFNGTLWVNKTIAGWLGYTPANASGTTNYVSKFTAANVLGNSRIFDNGVTIKTESATTYFVTDASASPQGGDFSFASSADFTMSYVRTGNAVWKNTFSGNSMTWYNNLLMPVFSSNNSGNVLIGTTTDNGADKLQVNGSTISTGYKIPSGLSTWFLKADGTYDTTSYQTTLSNPITGTGATGQVAFWNGNNTQTGDSGLVWDNVNKRLAVGTNNQFIVDSIGNVETRMSTTGSELSPSLISPNWTLNAGWAYGSNTLVRTSTGGLRTAFPTTPITIIANNTYRVIITATVTTGGFTIALGDLTIGTITSSGTHTLYGFVNTSSNSNLGFNAISDASVFTISSLSVQRLNSTTGTTILNGPTTLNSLVNIGNSSIAGSPVFINGFSVLRSDGQRRPMMTVNSTTNTVTLGSNNLTLVLQGPDALILSSTAEAMRIPGTRNVLINKTTDNGVDKLQVNGSGNFDTSTFSNTALIVKGNNGSAVSTFIQGGATLGSITGDGSGNLQVRASANLGLGAGTTNNQVVIIPNGNVGIGTTADPGFRLDVNGTARVSGELNTDADAVVNGVTIGRGGGNISSNTKLGNSSLFNNTTGTNNTVGGLGALAENTTGNNTSAWGYNAGRFQSNGTSNNSITNQSLFLGSNTKSLGNNQTNEIVIGYNANGEGSNSVVLGNDSITKTILKGNIGIGIATPRSKVDITGTASVVWSGGIDNTGLLTIGTQGTVGGPLFVNTPSANSAYGSGFGVDGTYTNPGGVGTSIIKLQALGVWSGGGYDSAFAFYTSLGTSATEKMRITSAGNVLIGITNSGADKLQVNGHAIATGYKIPSGLATQFLKANGSIDSSTYSLDNEVVKLTGDQSITGTKTFNISTSVDAILVNNSGGRGLRIINSTSGFGILINNGAAATATPFAIQKSGGTVLSMSDTGVISAASFNGSAALTGTPTAPTAAAGNNTTQIATTAFVQTSARPYKAYAALISQTGTAAPTAIVLENTLGGTVVWTRSATGTYVGTLTAAFTASKTIAFIQKNQTGGLDDNFVVGRATADTVGISTTNGTALIDSLLSSTSLEIRVYN